MHMQFEWHALKAETNSRKHGVTFDEARSCFFDAKQIAFYDPDYSGAEDRELLIRHSNQGRILLVSYTLRRDSIRIISARKATAPEAKRYAQGL